MHRHLFLGSCPITSLPLILQSQHFLISEGASWGDRPGHFTTPSATAEPALLPEPAKELRQGERDILFWLAQTPNNAVRYEIQRQLLKFGELGEGSEAELRGKVQVYGGLGRENSSYGRPPMQRCIAEMQRSIFCPAPPAENTAGLVRFFDALRAGCIPVVVSFHTSWGSGVSWWRHNGPPVEWSLPFVWEVNWRQLVMEVPVEHLSSPGFVKTCLQLGREGVEAKQRHIARVRDYLGYDFNGGRRDAFSLLMDGIRSALPRLGPPLSVGALPQLQSPQICDRTSRSAQHRLLFPSGSEIREKAWSHSFTEISCLPLRAWHPPNHFLAGDPQPVILEHYTTRIMLKRSLHTPAFWFRSLEASSVAPGDADEILAAAPMAVCRHQDFPRACHDLLVPGPERVNVDYCFASTKPMRGLRTFCTLIPAFVATGPSRLPTERWEFLHRRGCPLASSKDPCILAHDILGSI